MPLRVVNVARLEMAELLVSVRSVVEMEAALAGGAGLIDVKEPLHGSLGRACDATISAVLRQLAGRQPMSVALGELLETPVPCAAAGLAYAKWGLAGCRAVNWRRSLIKAVTALQERAPGCRAVAVAYADVQVAGSPKVDEICNFACEHQLGAMLVDTWSKNGACLLDWIRFDHLAQLRERCRNSGVRLALAGSLGLDAVRLLRPIEPDWFAVRGAVCHSNHRTSAVDPRRVRRLVNCLMEPLVPIAES
jgi:uncharacterized protein (UPF0264 family)